MDIIGVGSLLIVMLIGLFSGAGHGLQMARALATYGAQGQIGPDRLHHAGARAGSGADGAAGGRPQRQRHRQRTGLHEGHRADRRHARAGHRSDSEAGDAAADRHRRGAAAADHHRRFHRPDRRLFHRQPACSTSAVRNTGPRRGRSWNTTIWCRACSSRLSFAIIIALVGCFYGMRTTGGTQGVGRSTTQAVVVSSIWIFVRRRSSSVKIFRQSLHENGCRRFHRPALRRRQPAFRRDAGAGSRFVRDARRRDARDPGRRRQRQDHAAEDRPGPGEARFRAACIVFGQDVTSLQRERSCSTCARKVGILFQEGGLFDSLTIAENVAYPLLNQRVAQRARFGTRTATSTSACAKRCASSNWSRPWTNFPASCPAACAAAWGSPARGDRAAAGAVRFAHGRPGPDHRQHHHRADPQGARPAQHRHRSW